ncbi:3-aminobutyryl-CoA aminotransferase [Polystyrenella longa]|uniref:3-aminobutyryl-CoA aminotransferase n=1 Tax=Polystyrenella longa TaxID=2528007 RepID=A0A518CNV9_9PLAN|nr:aminotransferase class III-fold pyridoxal phosphate-dependent enzyme [Polystyrenella longa]QDU80909.1 3-aminobutyryl-CoA aminotransferase [Polystyrenella longa]
MSLPQQPGSITQALYLRAKQLIPGGTQLLSKRPEMFAPEMWPAYYQSCKGCTVVDLDGREYIDMSIMGIGACLLGYADPTVTEAVIDRVQRGSMCTLNAPEEVLLAEELVRLHPWADQVRYARTGGEAMTVAVRIARAATNRSHIAFCGYHGWHDWYLAANRQKEDSLQGHLLPGLHPNGVPEELAGTAIPFQYNQIEQLEAIIKKEGSKLAAVVMEPTRYAEPDPGYLEQVRELCHKNGSLLVMDEITAGWRLHLGGAHLKYGVDPDIAVFGKALGNGHPMAAIIGTRDAMQAAQETFISSTYWTEAVGPAAALATLKKMKETNLPEELEARGDQLRGHLAPLAAEFGIPLKMLGHPPITHFQYEHPQAAEIQTYITVRMLERGILAGAGFYASLAHTSENIHQYLEAYKEIFAELQEAVEKQTVDKLLKSPVKHGGFSRLN